MAMLLGANQPLRSRVTLQPGSGIAVLGNGTSLSAVLLLSDPVGGYPPYTHDWHLSTGTNMSLQSSASATSLLQSTGTNVATSGNAVYVLTDAAGHAVTTSANLEAIHGTP